MKYDINKEDFKTALTWAGAIAVIMGGAGLGLGLFIFIVGMAVKLVNR